MMTSEMVYLNDGLVSAEKAKVSAYDAGLLHGVGLFETMRSYGGRVFRLADHLERLFQSAGALGLSITQSRERMADAVNEVLRANGLSEARIRLTVTRGSILAAAEGSPASTLLVTASAMAGYPAEYYQKGMMVLISPYKQNPDDPVAGHKTINYFPRLLALQQAQRAGAGEALWFTTGNRLAEGCISNVFLVKEGKLSTPPLDAPVLPGIARKAVLELAQAEGIECRERELSIQDLLQAEEVFLTNSIMELMPVCRVERHPVGTEKPGEVYQRLHEKYRESAKQ